MGLWRRNGSPSGTSPAVLLGRRSVIENSPVQRRRDSAVRCNRLLAGVGSSWPCSSSPARTGEDSRNYGPRAYFLATSSGARSYLTQFSVSLNVKGRRRHCVPRSRRCPRRHRRVPKLKACRARFGRWPPGRPARHQGIHFATAAAGSPSCETKNASSSTTPSAPASTRECPPIIS